MKLSEAIRLGSLLRPQAFAAYLDSRGRSCAIGAALEAIGVDLTQGHSHALIEYQQTPEYLEWGKSILDNPATFLCPECGSAVENADGSSTIIHLNNQHKWTREEIADWVATLETESAPVETRELVGAAP